MINNYNTTLKLTLTLFLLTVFANFVAGQNIYYVSPTGNALNDGSLGSPKDLISANNDACSNNIDEIRLLSGTYNLSQKLQITCADIEISGNWIDIMGVASQSTSVTTTLNIDSSLEEVPHQSGGILVGVYKGVEAINVDDFVLENLIFNVKDGGMSGVASGTTGNRGRSVYGFYFNGSNGWDVRNCVMNVGEATQGANGIDGASGSNGVNGGTGTAADCNDDCTTNRGGNGGHGGGGVSGAPTNIDGSCRNSGQNGSNGTSGNARQGGSGGSGGSGGAENNRGGFGGRGGNSATATAGNGGAFGNGNGSTSPGNCSTVNALNGTSGADGNDGTNGVTVSTSTTYEDYWLPSDKSTDGTDGTGGAGGGGGGGGGGQGCFFCTDGTGGAGGGGGGGGQGGEGGQGGYGSGGAFALYAAGSDGNAVNNNYNIPTVAPGSNGGLGGFGGNGGNGGGIGGTSGGLLGCSTCEVGRGGFGGRGGSGGRGGNGGPGASGISEDVRTVYGSIITSISIDDASFTYAATSYCVDSADPTPTITGETGGTFSSTAGLAINNTSGAIDISMSTPGSYIVTYTTQNPNQNSSTQNITINELDDANFSYSVAAYCADAIDPIPTITGLTGGIFSARTGLSINASTGAIDVSASTAGSYIITYMTNGTCSNSSTAAVTINALDDAGFSYSNVSFCPNSPDPTPTISGLTGGAFSSTTGLSINSTTGVIDLSASTQGVYTVTYATAGICPNSTQVSLTVIDNEAPTPGIGALVDVTAQCEVTSLTAPTATDNCAGTVTATTTTTLPITAQGTTVVTWTYDDGNGNTSTQNQNVIIDDTTPPVPDVASLPDVTSQCEVTTLTPPTATDNCGVTVTITNNATLPITTQGTTVVTWTYDDGNGNTFNQTQNVIIQDVTAPSITLPSEITVANDSGSCTAVVDYAAPIVSDNCVFPDETVAFLDRPSLFSGNARGYTFVVPQPMVITGLRVPTGASTGPQSIQVMRFANPISSFPTTNSYSELLFYTSRDPIDGFIPVNITLNTGDIIGILGVRDNVNAYSSSNSITIDGSPVQITRFGTQNPIDQIEAPQNTFWTEASGSVSQVDFTYNLSANLSAPVINQTAGLPSGSSFPVGTTINTFVATDISGNTTTQSFNVTVSDNEAPVADIAILADVIAECEVTSLVAPRATDNCTGVVTVTSDAVLPITGEGTTTVVTWTYDDGNGNTSTQTQNVIIDDVTAPVAEVATLSDVTAECEVSSLVAPTATDNCSGIITATSDTTLPITTQGTTVVTWTYDDGNGNTSTQTQNVIIDDVTAPVITCPANITGNAPVVTFTNPTAIDNCDTIPFGGVANNDPIPGLTYLGFFGGKNLYVSDNPFTGAAAFANAQSLGGHLVTITDATVNSQIITALNNLGISDAFIGYSDAANEGTFVWQDGSTSNYENFNSGEPNNSGSGEDYVHIFGSGLWNDTSNNSSFVYIFQSANNRFYQSAGLPSGATYPLGATTNTFIVTDASGNASTCSFDVVLSDTTAPVPDVAMLSDVTAQCEMTSLTAPTATDDFSGAITGTTTTILPITTQGTTVVTWTYDDGNGNTSTQTQNVIIDDVTAPVADVTTLADVTAECEVLSLTVPTATDNCVGTVTATTSTIFPITSQGTTVVTWTYDDGNGNTSTQTQNVIIDDITVPVLDAVSLSNLVFNCEVTSLTAPTATDNCAGVVTGTATFPITSTSVITWTYDDGNGNISTQDQL
ncbi:HYR domain-containing protein, partial [Nonlabens sp.]|uniref:HYR domain-containing protein n=1 Tax=Nonlabens sp. TaxID=1888209 RepID=UPI003F6A10FC